MPVDLQALAHIPDDPQDLPRYLQMAFPALIEALIPLQDMQRELNAAPTRPREGDIRTADGTNWDPGSGAGIYQFRSGSWVRIAASGGIDAYLPLAGGTMSGAIAMGSNKVTGLAAGSANGDALRYEQLIGLYLLLAGGTMTGEITHSNGIGDPSTEAVATGSLGASGLTLTHTFETGYDYWLHIEGAVPQTDGTVPYLRINGDSGSNYRWSGQQDDDVNASSDIGSTSDTEIQLVGGFVIGSATGENFNATLKIRNGASTSLYKVVEFQTAYYSAAARSASTIGVGVWLSASAATSIFIGCTGATPHFSAGTATLYRCKRS